ncbi:RNA polymerase sigma factor SigZ [uncultured Shewanella sp.]|uniref:RNA polymerase sigma factor SigZ n=1 Tax=uncultured Shewanella sp. TaxID=173975 RepID=UPI00261B6619|nr:RNA polymerase sigma factor SigZ [uncultured Shewanella sp.]
MKLEKIWDEYRTSLKAFLHSKVSNEADVDDLLQDILIKTHQHLHTVRSEKAIKSWLFQIASHTITDYYRQNGRVKHVELNEWVFNNENDDVSHQLNNQRDKEDSNEVIKQELAHCIEPFVHALSEDNNLLLTAIELEGMSQKEYAAANSIPYSTLKSRVKKARSQLRKVFDDCCHMQLDTQGNLMDYDVRENKKKSC